MDNLTKTLPNDLELLKKIIQEQQLIIQCKEQTITLLEERLRCELIKRFTPKSEQYPGQGDLFNEAEQLSTQPETELLSESVIKEASQDNTKTDHAPKSRPTRRSLPTDLPRETRVLDISEADKICECCGQLRHQMGESISEKLIFIPAQIKVIEYRRPKYACRHCEQTGTENTIKQASLPATPIPKSFASSSLLAQIILGKYQYSLPLYRQEAIFSQFNIELNRKTMSDWIIKSAQLLTPLYDQLKQRLLTQPIIQADETSLTVINNDKVKSYLWVYCCGADSPSKSNQPSDAIVLYDYQQGSRAGSCVSTYLEGYSGYLVTDGYSAYEQTTAKLAGCWAHARRYFMEAIQVQGNKSNKNNKNNKNNKHKTTTKSKAEIALDYISKLYALERTIKNLSPQEKYNQRQEQAKPIIDQYHQYLQQSSLTVLPNSLTGKAIQYSLKQWPKLVQYLNNGIIPIDNNRAERAVKPFVIGRKNWLFANTDKGAFSSAILYSIIETAKANGLNVFNYLQDCLNTLAQKQPDIESLLPWNKK